MSRLIDATELNGYKSGLISTYAQELFHDTISSAPTIKAIPLDKVKQARAEIKTYKHGNGNMYTCGLNKAVEILDKLIAESEGK